MNVVGFTLPDVGRPWIRVGPEPTTWRPEFKGADAQFRRRYAAGGRTADVFLAYYAYQREGAELVFWGNRIADEDTWTPLGGGSSELVVDGSSEHVNYTRIASRREQRLVYHWYWVDGRFTHADHVAKLLTAKARLLGGTQASAAILVSVPYDDDLREAKAAAQDLLARMAPLEPSLRAAAPK